MKTTTRCRIPVDHPSIAGHFPGDPIVPGVVILDEVYAALRAHFGDCRLQAVPNVKFLAPLRPAQEFAIHLKRSALAGRIEFECRLAERVFVKGLLTISEPR